MRNKQSNIQFLISQQLGGIKISRGIDVQHKFPVHTHDSYCIGIITKGLRTGFLNTKYTTIHEGQIFILNPGEPHSCETQANSGHDYLVISIPQTFFQSNYYQTETTWSIPHFKKNIIQDHLLCQNIYNWYFSITHTIQLEKKKSLLISLLMNLIVQYSEKNSNATLYEDNYFRILEVIEYIKDHYDEKISISKLAHIANLSPFYFCKVFHKIIGLSPNSFQIQTRIKKACNLILKGESLADIAIHTGFNDQSHFYRFFKRNLGLTPLQYLYSSKEI